MFFCRRSSLVPDSGTRDVVLASNAREFLAWRKILDSISRLMPLVVAPEHKKAAALVRKMLATYARSEDLIRIGAYEPGADIDLDRAIHSRAQIRGYLEQDSGERVSFFDAFDRLAFLSLALCLAYLGRHVDRAPDGVAISHEGRPKTSEKAQAENLAGLLKMDDLSLEIGFQLIPLVDEKQGGQMLARVRTLRRQLASELGFLIPPIHISDNLRLKPREYVFSLRGIEIGRWQTEGNSLLAVSAEANPRPLPGKETREPAFGVSARWIQPALEDQAMAAGYSVVDMVTAISTHLAEMIRQRAYELLSRAETKRLLDSLNETHPKLVEELVPKGMTLGEVQRVLQQLLREQVSIRDLGTILEALVENVPSIKSLPQLVESARQALGRRVLQPLLDSDGSLRVLVLDPAIEEELVATFQHEGVARLLGDGRGQTTPLLKRVVNSLKQLIGPLPPAVLPCFSVRVRHDITCADG
jgi:flagellar biosynthesis protein FlhA